MRKLLIVLLAGLGISAFGDVLILKNGDVITGTVLQKDANGTLMKLDYATITYPDSLVKEVQRDETSPATNTPILAESPDRIPRWGKIITQLAKKSWATELQQIPATVIDKGVLMNVPYMSFRAAYGYEINIYGDPDHPAGFEIGVQRHLANNDSAKSNCLEFITNLMPNTADRATISKLKWTKDKVTVNGIIFELTPPTDEDAYGGWWVSVYNAKSIESARASWRELSTITEIVPQRIRYRILTDGKIDSESKNPTTSTVDIGDPNSYRGGSTGLAKVYVRGYYRKDGTYVSSHTRSAPTRRR